MEAFETGKNMQEYLSLCTGQMRCKAMRPTVEAELAAHIRDQKEAYMQDGMAEEEAEALAVRQMGDPVEAGNALDRVHRPKMDWKTAGLILLLAVLGLAVQILMNRQDLGGKAFLNFAVSTGIGLVLMAAVCFADYTVLGKYPRIVWCLSAAVTIVVYLLSPRINGVHRGEWVIMLLAPAYAGIVFYYRTQREKGIGKALLWLIGTCGVIFLLTGSLAWGILSKVWLCGCIVMLAFAVGRGWYGKKRRIAVLLLLLPAGAVIAAGGWLLYRGGYQGQRILAMLHPEDYAEGSGYLMVQIRQCFANLKLWGSTAGGVLEEVLSDNREDFAFLWVAQNWGLAFGILLIILLFVLTGLLVWRIGRQKNRLGAVIGIGCIYVFAVPVLIHILLNTGLFLNTACSLPFISMSGRQGICLYILMGLLLSVYRGSNIRPEPRPAVRFRTGQE